MLQTFWKVLWMGARLPRPWAGTPFSGQFMSNQARLVHPGPHTPLWLCHPVTFIQQVPRLQWSPWSWLPLGTPSPGPECSDNSKLELLFFFSRLTGLTEFPSIVKCIILYALKLLAAQKKPVQSEQEIFEPFRQCHLPRSP